MSATFAIEGTTTVTRLGFGAMRITGQGIWGPPRDHDEAIADAIRPPDFRTKTSSPSTSERRLRKDELPEGDGSQG